MKSLSFCSLKNTVSSKKNILSVLLSQSFSHHYKVKNQNEIQLKRWIRKKKGGIITKGNQKYKKQLHKCE